MKKVILFLMLCLNGCLFGSCNEEEPFDCYEYCDDHWVHRSDEWTDCYMECDKEPTTPTNQMACEEECSPGCPDLSECECLHRCLGEG